MTNLGGMLSIPVDVLSCSSVIILIMSSLVACLNLNSVKLLRIFTRLDLIFYLDPLMPQS